MKGLKLLCMPYLLVTVSIKKAESKQKLKSFVPITPLSIYSNSVYTEF